MSFPFHILCCAPLKFNIIESEFFSSSTLPLNIKHKLKYHKCIISSFCFFLLSLTKTSSIQPVGILHILYCTLMILHFNLIHRIIREQTLKSAHYILFYLNTNKEVIGDDAILGALFCYIQSNIFLMAFFAVCPKWVKLRKNHTEKKSVLMLILCSSAVRALELIRLEASPILFCTCFLSNRLVPS